MSAEVNKLRLERDSAAAPHHGLLAPIHHVVKAREDRNDKAAKILVKLRKIYDEGGKVMVGAHVMK